MLKGTYIVQRMVGSGGMGEVYEVGHVRLAGRYAVKVLRGRSPVDEELLARFRREAEITSALRHPHIVQVIDFDRTDGGCVFLAMEYLEGCDLATLLEREGRLRCRGRWRWSPGRLGAVGGAPPGDRAPRPQPANVFVLRDDETREGGAERVKLMDFGLSKWTEATFDGSLSLSRDQALIGTPRYMAPEQARGRNREVSSATYQFALAAMTYEMLAGEAPFSGRRWGMPARHPLRGPQDLRSLRPELPAGVAAAVHRALSKEPEKRFPSILAFARRWRLRVGRRGSV